MTDRKNWGQTVLGWFIVPPEGTAGEGSAVVPAPPDAGSPPPADPAAFFKTSPPPAPGGHVEFPGVFEAAGIDADERGRVDKAVELISSLPSETPVGVKRQIVEASLKAFGVPLDSIIEAAASEIQALEGYIRAGASDTDAVLEESRRRIAQHEEEVRTLRTVMDQRVQEQQAVVASCNGKKLEVQQVLEFFGQEAVRSVVQASPRLVDPSGGSFSSH